MDFRQLEAFIATVDHQSFSAAAEALENAGIKAEVNLETKTVSVADADVNKAKEEIEDIGFEV